MEVIMLSTTRKIILAGLVFTFALAFCLFATGADKFKLTYVIPKGYDVKSITLVFLPGEQLHVVAVDKKSGITLLLVYEPNKAEPVAMVKFQEQ
jgi:hypothetical protein